VELLHKSLEEFVEEFKSLYDTDYSHHAVRQVFQEHERQRLSEFQIYPSQGKETCLAYVCHVLVYM